MTIKLPWWMTAPASPERRGCQSKATRLGIGEFPALEATLDVILKDPIVSLVMASDSVTETEVKALFAKSHVHCCRHGE